MDMVTTLFIAFGLAMDAFSVSITNGITIYFRE
jgi:putative Mn2+ efflux pump MntP